MDPTSINRLRQVQEKAIAETLDRIKQFQKFLDDYKTLKNRLSTLADKVSYDVMVPFGSVAFMPGKLIHTNEIKVLLGDNWFVERSSKQAAEIIQRRISNLEKQIEDLNRQKGLIEPRLEFTSELQDVAQAKGDVFEIMEEYDEEAETAWKEQHRENVKRFHEKEREERLARQSAEEAPSIKNKCSGENASDMEAIWKRLDELEALENEEEEKCQSLNNIIKINGGGDCQPASAGTKQSCSQERPASSESSKSVKWLDLEKVSKDDAKNDDGSEVEDSDDASSDDEQADADKELICRTKTINFVHSPVEPNISSADAALPLQDVTKIVSPADIYRHILRQPKSILKTASTDQESNSRTVNTRQESKQISVRHAKLADTRSPPHDETNNNDLSGCSSTTEQTTSTKEPTIPYTSTIVERNMNHFASASHKTVDNSPTMLNAKPDEPKRISKFKSSRHKQTAS